jgi:hypothetical protein
MPGVPVRSWSGLSMLSYHMGVGATNKRVEDIDEANGRIFEGFRMRRYAFVGMIYYATKLMGAFLKAFLCDAGRSCAILE